VATGAADAGVLLRTAGSVQMSILRGKKSYDQTLKSPFMPFQRSQSRATEKSRRNRGDRSDSVALVHRLPAREVCSGSRIDLERRLLRLLDSKGAPRRSR